MRYVKDENKVLYLDALEKVRHCAIDCFKGKFKRGSVDCLNFIAKTCLLIPDVFILKSTFKLLGFLYIFFNKMKFAITSFERLRDVADEDEDFLSIMFAYR